MDIDELLRTYIDGNKDVTFPVAHADRENLNPSFEPFGFSTDGSAFRRSWRMSFNAATRVAAAFTGVLYVERDASAGTVYLRLKVFSSPPLNRVEGLPEWYPIPRYARYGPFTAVQLDDIVRNLFTDDEDRIGALVGGDADTIGERARQNENRVASVGAAHASQLRAEGIVPSATPIVEAIRAFVDGSLHSGVPMAAGGVLINSSDPITFTLHPSEPDGEIVGDVFFDPHFYFKKWKSRIEGYDEYPGALRDMVVAPPVTTGNVHYVAHTPVSGIAQTIPSLEDAVNAAQANDIVLILDNAVYSLEKLTKHLSIMSLKPPSDEVTELDGLSDEELDSQLEASYPTIRNSDGRRGLYVRHMDSEFHDHWLVYLANLSVSGNRLNVNQEVIRSEAEDPNSAGVGGAGILVHGYPYFSNVEYPDSEFFRVHIENCAVVDNEMAAFPSDGKLNIDFGGGGILCRYSSPLISQCLIRGNSSYFHGGGIGILPYGFPMIIRNVISQNEAVGHPVGDPSGDPGRYGNGDGGGIGVFQAYPEHREEAEQEILSAVGVLSLSGPVVLSILVADKIRRLLPTAWDPARLAKAKTKWIRVSHNHIHHNEAAMSGGGVYGTVCALLALWQNRIDQNTAEREDGGGIAMTFGSRMTIGGNRRAENSIRGNRASRQGGGIYLRSSEARIATCVIRDNSEVSGAGLRGGGVAVESRSEILGGELLGIPLPRYDVILRLIWDHIDEVRLHAADVDITENRTASGSSDLFVLRDSFSYGDSLRLAGMVFDLIHALSVHVRIGVIGGVRGLGVDLLHRHQAQSMQPPSHPVEDPVAPNYVVVSGVEILENRF